MQMNVDLAMNMLYSSFTLPSPTDFTFEDEIILSSVTPSVGLLNTNHQITLAGANFITSRNMMVRLRYHGYTSSGEDDLTSTIISVMPTSSSEIRVNAIHVSPGPMNIEVSSNGLDYTSSEVAFIFEDQPALAALFP